MKRAPTGAQLDKQILLAPVKGLKSTSDKTRSDTNEEQEMVQFSRIIENDLAVGPPGRTLRPLRELGFRQDIDLNADQERLMKHCELNSTIILWKSETPRDA
jgi:hypothetical protein